MALATSEPAVVDGVMLAGTELEPSGHGEPDVDGHVALLPTLDPTTMGWTARDWYLGEHRAQLFDSAGNAGATVWWRGRVVGGWAARPDGGGDRWVAALQELDDAAFEGGPLDQHVAVAGRAAEADVGAQPVDEPGVAAAGVASLEPDHVAQQQREHGMA